jgi:lipopolysaccharide export system permease protein
MSIITRYICRRLLLYYLGLMVVMLAFFIFIDFMENIERVTRHHASFELLSLYYACLTPRVFIEVSWISFLVSILFVLGGLVKNNEMAALLSGGISIYSIGIPVTIIGIVLYVLVFLVQEFIAPQAMLTAFTLDKSDFSKRAADSTVFDLAGIGRRNLFYNCDVADMEHGVLFKVHVHKMKNGILTERIDSEQAVWDPASERWTLENGTIKKFAADGSILETSTFSRTKAPFKESPETLKNLASERAQLNYKQLNNQIKNLEKSGYDPQRLKVQYYAKFAIPAANIIVVFLALPFSLECRKGGLTIGFALSLLAAILYYGTVQIGITLGKGGSLPAVLSAWLANILFLCIGAGLTLKART